MLDLYLSSHRLDLNAVCRMPLGMSRARPLSFLRPALDAMASRRFNLILNECRPKSASYHALGSAVARTRCHGGAHIPFTDTGQHVLFR